MGKLITYGIIAIIVLAVLFFGLKYPGKFIDMTGSAVGWVKEKTGGLLDKTEVDEQVTDAAEVKASELSDTIVAKLKEKGFEALADETIEITVPNEEGIEETYTCIKHEA